MGLCGARKLLLVLVITVYVFSETAEGTCWSCGPRPNSKPGRKIPIPVWKKGLKYQTYTDKYFPIHVNDVLVFKYMKKNTSVYLLPDLESFERCDLKRGKKLGARGRGSSRGFKFLLRSTTPYGFVSGDRYGCKHYNMRFDVAAEPQLEDTTTT